MLISSAQRVQLFALAANPREIADQVGGCPTCSVSARSVYFLLAGRNLAFGAHSRIVWRKALSHRSYTTTSGFSASSTSAGKSVKVSESGYVATSHGFKKT